MNQASTSMPRHRWLAVALTAALFLGACTDGDTQVDGEDATNATPVAADDGGDQQEGEDGPDNTIGSRDDGEADIADDSGDAGDEAPSDTESTNTVPADPQAPRVVAFEPGASAIVMSDSVVRGNRHTYTIAAGGGQTMELLITSLEENAVFDLIDPSGNVIESEATNTSTVLPADGVYRVVVGGTRGNATYELTIVIPPGTADPDESAQPTDGPEAIRFAAGATSATVTGQVQDSQVKMYTIDVSAGQTMTFALTSIQNNGALTVVAPSGQLIMTDVTLEEFVLEESGEYRLLVNATQGQASYELTVTVV